MIKKFIINSIVIALTIVFAHAQGQRTRLINDWKFFRGDLGGIWEAVRTVGEGAPESVPAWTDVTLPHCFNAEDAVDPDVSYYQGAGWYRTLIPITNPYSKGRTLLHFEGAGQKTEVYIYTTRVGSHVGGYDEWTVDITDAVEAVQKNEALQKQFGGKIPLVIRCDNSRDLEMIPSNLSDFNVYGGMMRYLNLVYTPPASVNHLSIASQVTEQGIALLQVKTELRNCGQASATLDIQLISPAGKVIERQRASLTAKDSLYTWNATLKKPQLWSPAQPYLYTVEAKLTSPAGVHIYSEKTGIRSFTFEDHGPFLLNGKRLLLRGTHRHEDHAGVGGAMTEAMIRQEMIMMKTMGVNFIRLGHYQQSRIVLNLCDSLGILVWEEIPWCRGGLGGDVYKAQARRMLTNMIRQHYNHPSVILWGLGNENDWPGDFPEFDKAKIRAFMKELNGLAHATDPSRKTAIRRCDFCKDIVDVYSPSIWAGWYRGRYTEYKEVSRKEFEGVKHFLHVEWGGDSHAGRHSEEAETVVEKITTGSGADERKGDASLYGGSTRVSKDGDWSETYICNLIDWHLKEQETMPWLTGTAYWPFKDFSTPVRPDNPVPYVNQKGVVARDFTPKESYYVFQSYWTDKPMAHIYGHTWPVRWGKAGEQKMVKVYSNCDEAELFVNGKSYGIKKRNSQDFPAAGLRWMVSFANGNNILRVKARKDKVVIEDEITQRYQSESWGNPAKLVAEKIGSDGDTVTVQVKLVDENNILCLDARNWTYFSLAGEGKLIDNLGTSSGSRKVQAYNGRTVIKLDTNAGKNILCVQSPGLPVIFLNLAELKTAAP
jgi:beta-galactosidase